MLVGETSRLGLVSLAGTADDQQAHDRDSRIHEHDSRSHNGRLPDSAHDVKGPHASCRSAPIRHAGWPYPSTAGRRQQRDAVQSIQQPAAHIDKPNANRLQRERAYRRLRVCPWSLKINRMATSVLVPAVRGRRGKQVIREQRRCRQQPRCAFRLVGANAGRPGRVHMRFLLRPTAMIGQVSVTGMELARGNRSVPLRGRCQAACGGGTGSRRDGRHAATADGGSRSPARRR
jgi:hypothetical protein